MMTLQAAEAMMKYFGNDVKRINHALKVLGFARSIAHGENLNEKEFTLVELSAIMHDIGIQEAERKYQSTAGHYQEMEGPAIARALLTPIVADKDIIERVCFIVGHHHSYTKIDGIDFQILVEADFLVNFFEMNMNTKTISTAVDRYFVTNTARKLASQMYL